MNTYQIPTSREISVTINGVRQGVVQGYTLHAEKESRSLEAFGSSLPVATVTGREQYTITLKRLLLPQQPQEDFFDLEDFTLAIVKPECQIVFSGCQWQSIDQSCTVGENCLETVTVVAQRRMVLE